MTHLLFAIVILAICGLLVWTALDPNVTEFLTRLTQ